MMGGFLKCNNNITIKYKTLGAPYSNNCWGLPENKTFDSYEPRNMAGAPKNPIMTLLSSCWGLPKEMMGAS